MSRAEDQPWSPFPVQDWSRLPEDPLAYSAVDPSWGPPEPPRRWWIPLVVLAVIGALVGGATFAGHTVGLGPPRTPATAFLPADGTAAYEMVETIREVADRGQLPGHRVGPVQRRDRAAEHRHDLRHPAVRRDLRRARHAPDLEDHQQHLQRPGRPVRHDPDVPGQRARSSCWGRAGRALGTFTGRRSSSCPRTCGPARRGAGPVRPTTSWTTGASSGPRPVTTASDVTGEVRYLSKQGQAGPLVNLERTWCPGLGMVRASESFRRRYQRRRWPPARHRRFGPRPSRRCAGLPRTAGCEHGTTRSRPTRRSVRGR